MQTPQTPPAKVTNIPRWEEHCRKIHARASELIAGKLGIINAAIAIETLANWTHATKDADFAVFESISRESVGLPVGQERQYWAQDALKREDVKIQALEDRWRSAAEESARKLVERYSWAPDARRRRRIADHAG